MFLFGKILGYLKLFDFDFFSFSLYNGHLFLKHVFIGSKVLQKVQPANCFIEYPISASMSVKKCRKLMEKRFMITISIKKVNGH